MRWEVNREEIDAICSMKHRGEPDTKIAKFFGIPEKEIKRILKEGYLYISRRIDSLDNAPQIKGAFRL